MHYNTEAMLLLGNRVVNYEEEDILTGAKIVGGGCPILKIEF